MSNPKDVTETDLKPIRRRLADLEREGRRINRVLKNLTRQINVHQKPAHR